jgi:formiminoglutamase
LIGFACDEGVRRNQGRIGAALAPVAVRRALSGTANHMINPLYDAGDVVCLDGSLDAAQEILAQQVTSLLQKKLTIVVLGGGHETAYGSYNGLRRHLDLVNPDSVLGIINFDAHFDLRSTASGAHSGTPFTQMAEACRLMGQPFRYACFGISRMANSGTLFERAESLGVSYLLDTELASEGRKTMLSGALRDFVAACDQLYLSIDLDVLPAGIAPGVSAPAALGIPFDILLFAVDVLRQAVDTNGRPKLLLADICELNPHYDIDNRTAKVAARLCHHLFS